MDPEAVSSWSHRSVLALDFGMVTNLLASSHFASVNWLQMVLTVTYNFVSSALL